MQFDFSRLSKQERYKLLVSFIVPRPIALVTTRSLSGINNAAPMSFFNVFGDDPAIIILGIQHRPDGRPKDTTQNIRDSGEFVVNLVDEPIAQKMITCSIEFPPDVDELKAAGLTLEPSVTIGPGWIAEAPAALECRTYQTLEFPSRSVIVGEVLYMHVHDRFIDPQTLRVRETEYNPLARLHADTYLLARRQFVLPRITYEEWLGLEERSE
ncbi:MAG TPA: flavin reductase family protein [Candidatus Competibacteraceae bacterium]|nr:flavin reductase family protein [Candidatus Competibacteraceae bacterium]